MNIVDLFDAFSRVVSACILALLPGAIFWTTVLALVALIRSAGPRLHHWRKGGVGPLSHRPLVK